MANTYTQLYVHYVFAVQDRLCLINNILKLDKFAKAKLFSFSYTA